MTQPVRLSAALVQDARETGEVMERSIAGQIEYWARLGRAVEAVLRGGQAQAWKRRGDLTHVMAALADTDENRAKVQKHLAQQPYPHFERDEDGVLVRIAADGTRTRGRIVGRTFQPIEAEVAK
jgi:hypothetical protein